MKLSRPTCSGATPHPASAIAAVPPSGLAGWLALACLGVAMPALAQRASENAVTAAEDAFGLAVGRESIGLYTADNVRGFSALDAGNMRLDGLYFDQVWGPSPRLLDSTTVRVGIASQGFLFPAPTGVVDYALRRPDTRTQASAYVSTDSYDNRILELDYATPLSGDALALGIGAADNQEGYADGSSDRVSGGAVMLHGRPTGDLDLLGFWSRAWVSAGTNAPYYVPAGAWRPPPVERRHFAGPGWAINTLDGGNQGMVARWTPNARWKLELGVFESEENDPLTFNNLYLGLSPQGTADQLLQADANDRTRSRSGELRLSHAFGDGQSRQLLVATLRGRERERSYGGSALIDLGAVAVGQVQTVPEPALQFGAKDRDGIRQGTLGLSWRANWRDGGELTLGLQRTHYDKRVELAGQAATETRSQPWLPNAAGSLPLGERWVLYASDTQGLEDSGSAPPAAVNRNQPLAAVRTHQRDAGVRWAALPKLTLIAGVFDLRKPYYSFDAGQRFVQLGQVINRGLEFSLSGALSPNLDLVLGSVAGSPRVTGTAGSPGMLGVAPVGLPRQRALGNAEWRPQSFPGLAIDLGFTHTGSRPATADNLVHLPARTTVDLGARYLTHFGNHPAQLRLAVSNLGNAEGFDTYGSGTYNLIPGRVFQLSLGVDG